MTPSTSGVLNKYDWKSIGKGALIAAGGALAAYLATQLSIIDWATLGKYGYIIAPFASIVINFLRKWATDNTK